jgi:hypothetical protein
LATGASQHAQKEDTDDHPFDDFSEELKESEVLTLCRGAGIITKNIYNSMHAALGKRNAAAHPNEVVISSAQADAFIEDLITNVVHEIA